MRMETTVARRREGISWELGESIEKSESTN